MAGGAREPTSTAGVSLGFGARPLACSPELPTVSYSSGFLAHRMWGVWWQSGCPHDRPCKAQPCGGQSALPRLPRSSSRISYIVRKTLFLVKR